MTRRTHGDGYDTLYYASIGHVGSRFVLSEPLVQFTGSAPEFSFLAMSKLFISHSSQDDGFVRGLQQALGDLNQAVWIDSRELRGGDPLWSLIQKAIEEASAYAVYLG